jgi:hypothetical protein
VNTKPNITAKLNHHWPRYGMKTLILGMIVTCLLLGTLAGRLRQAHEQRQLTADIERLGGTVVYNITNMGKTSHLLAGLLGVDLVANVDWVDLTNRPANSLVEHGSTISNADLFPLRRLCHLRVLLLRGAGVSDGGLVHIKGLTELRCLNLNGTQITDAGLSHLRGLGNLRWLYLNRTKVTGTGLVDLRRLKHLEVLSLQETRVSDVGLLHLRHFPTIMVLNLEGTNVTDAGIMYLRELANLRILFVERTHVTNEGIETLKQYLPFVRTQPRGFPSNRYPTWPPEVRVPSSLATSR